MAFAALVVLLASCSSRPVGPNASEVAALCPGSIAGRAESADGLPNVHEILVDGSQVQAVLAGNEAALRSRYPNVTSLEVGPGFGQAWDGTNGGGYGIVEVRDFGIIVHLRSRADCPSGESLFASIGRVPLFFASP
jgi:hypothetical protein